MSEEAKVAYLKEKIRQIEVRRLESLLFIVFGIAVGVAFPYGGYVFGLFLVIVGIIWGAYYQFRHADCIRQLKEMAYATKCQKCGKIILEKRFTFCPYCRASLAQRR